MIWLKSFGVGAALLLMWGVVVIASAANATNPAKVRAALDTDQPVWMGQKVSFHVDLMSPTFFSGTPTFDLPTLSGVVLMKVDERPVVSTEPVDGDSYSVQRHQFVLFPQRPGTISVPAFRVRFAVAPAFGKPPMEQTLMTDTLTVEVRMPPGTAGLSMLISTTELRLDSQWSPRLGDDYTANLNVGDALTHRMTLRAVDIPGMALPPMPFGQPAGLGVYPKPPAVSDSTQRGEFTGQRVETVTYVCEKPGTYTLPALTIPWFDVDDEQWQKVELPAVTLEVAANPIIAAEAPPPEGTQPQRATGPPWQVSMAALVILAAAVLFWRFRRRLATRLSMWRARRAESEAATFAAVKTACQSGNPAMTRNALMRWLDRVYDGEGVATVEQFVQDAGDDELRDQADRLDRLLFQPDAAPPDAWSADAFYRRVVHARTQLHRGRTWSNRQQRGILLPLNP